MNLNVALSTIFALGAAALFGYSTVLQQTAVRQEEDLPLLGVRVLGRMVRRPRWLAAVTLSGLSFAVQAIALAFGPLVLVLPIAATDLLFALVILVGKRHLRLRPADWLGALLVAIGVATFLVLTPRSAGVTEPALADWLLVAVAVGGVLAVLLPLALRLAGTARTALLAAAGAVVFGLVDSLTKAFVGSIDLHGIGALARWQPYALFVAGMTGILLAQSAYRAGSLFVSLPIIDSVEPIAGVAIGATVFGEQLARSPATLGVQLLAGAVAVVGMVVLRKSPLIAAT